MELHVDIYHSGQWHHAAVLQLLNPEQGRLSPTRLMYLQDYALDWMFRDDRFACSVNLPIELMFHHRSNQWFGFLEDIVPSGASRRFWVNRLGISHLPQGAQDTILLETCTIAPVGNLRIHNSLPSKDDFSTLGKKRFDIADVIERQVDFLDYAQEMGAASGGATGACGEAPKLLLRCSMDDEVWIDTWQDDPLNQDASYLVKFPRGKMTSIDCDILRAEYHFYHELTDLCVETISTEKMRLIEGSRYPSLWLPRFDIAFNQNQQERYGLESVYSVLEKEAGSFLNHFDVLRQLVAKLTNQQQVLNKSAKFDQQQFISEWLKRDLLNVIFGNSDNHGRNTAFIKRASGVTLAPVYDFAPMRADPEGVIRTMKWGAPFEQGGEYDWMAIVHKLADLGDDARWMNDLKAVSAQLVGLKQRLANRGVSQDILSMPVMGMNSIEQRLSRWGLL